MKKKLTIIIPILILLVCTFLIFFNTKISNKLSYQKGNYIFLLQASPNDKETDTSLPSFLVETNQDFKVLAKEKNDRQYTQISSDNKMIKLYNNDKKYGSCINIKNNKKINCIITKQDLAKMDKIKIGLLGYGMYFEGNDFNVVISPEITFKDNNHDYFVVSGIRLK